MWRSCSDKRTLPQRSGCYALYSDTELVYIGKAKSLRQRLLPHPILKEIKNPIIKFTECEDKEKVESKLLGRLVPRLNKRIPGMGAQRFAKTQKAKTVIRRVRFMVTMDDEIRKMLESYSQKTGRKYQFIIEHGIRVAIDTDCRYGGDIPLVDLVAGNGCYKVPEPVAKEWQKLIDKNDELKSAAIEKAESNGSQ